MGVSRRLALSADIGAESAQSAKRLDKRERAWRDTISLLRVAFPCAYPVEVRRVKFTPKSDRWADTTLRTKGRWHFIIRIDRALQEPARSLILMHEWAHALAWHPNHRSVEDHGPEWGVAHARIWQGVVES